MTKKVFLIKGNEYDWDYYIGFVVVAESKTEAVNLVKDTFYESQFPLDVTEINPDKHETGIVLDSFHAD